MPYFVHGLKIPEELVSVIEVGRWVPPTDEEVYLTIFGEPAVQPEFYDLEMMIRQNDAWRNRSIEEVSFEGGRVEGNLGIDPQKSILIGDLGPDMPIALDYRRVGEPIIIYLAYRGSPVWVCVAPNIGSLLSQLQL